MTQAKKNLRKVIRKKINEIDPSRRDEYSKKISSFLLIELQRIKKSLNLKKPKLGLYWPLEDEVNWSLNGDLVKWMNENTIMCFPYHEADQNFSMNFYACRPQELEEIESFGKVFKVPKKLPDSRVETLDICLVPSIGFNKHNKKRLGRGCGYYDRYFSAHICIKIGVCFSVSLFDTLELENHDITVDFLITEQRSKKS